MRNLKKFLALILAMMMTFSLMVTVSASSFEDDDDVTAAYGEAVDVLSELGVINGYENADKTFDFKPKDNITRGEVAAILYRIVTGDVDGDNLYLYKHATAFKDVYATDWYAPYINFCENNRLIEGVGDNMFKPNDNITGYEALTMILRAIGYDNRNEYRAVEWKTWASGYGARLGLTTNIKAGSLGAPATREVVAEIMFQGIQSPMVNYTILNNYSPILLVDASAVNANATALAGAAKVIYAADVAETLLHQTFGIVGKRNVLGSDNYGRPQTEWVKDLATDTVENGGKYIPNYISTADATKGQADETTNAKTPDAKWATQDTRKDSAGNALTLATGQGIEPAELEIAKTPVKVYKGEVVTECQFTTDVNKDKTIKKGNVTEYLNGGLVATRASDMDINHTQEGTIGAAGRITEVYKIGDNFIIVYIDTFMGVVTKVINRTFDTAGNHVMSDAELHVKVNDAVTVVDTSSKKDFGYKVGELVLMNTYGFEEATGIAEANLQTSVPVVENDFKCTGDAANDTWAVDTVGKPTSEDVTVKGTFGTKNHKTGVETDKGDKMGNVVFLANKSADTIDAVATGVTYWKDNGGTAAKVTDADTTVPSTSPYNYGHRMANAAINKSYTIYKDENGFVVGMTAAEAGSDVGVVMAMEPVRIGTGKWAIEAELMMMDKTTKTVRLVDHDACADDGTAITGYKFFEKQTDAETGIGSKNLKANAGVLVKVEPFTLEGATYYKVTETNEGRWKNFANADAAYSATAGGSAVVTGEADTLAGNATPGDTLYSANPTNVTDTTNAGKFVDKVDENVDDNTKFLIAEVNWDYSLNEGNVGGYTDMDYSAYTGFKTIPTVESSKAHVMFQRIGNNVFVHPLDTALKGGTLEYTIKGQDKVDDVDAYLVYATGVTYQDYSTYKALKNGEPVELKVSNNNLKLVNDKIETAMAKATVVLLTVSSTNSKGYATDVDVTTLATSNKLVLAGTVYSDKTGVLAYDADGGKSDGTAVDKFYTVADDCVVKIVNLETGKYYNATLDSVSQYEKYDVNGNGTYDPANDGHDFIIDFDEYGYVDTIYIID